MKKAAIPISPLHLTLGGSAAGCVRAALELISPGRHQPVLCIQDDLSHGPLHDATARTEYMRSLYQDYGEGEGDLPDALAAWLALVERLDRDQHDVLVVWAGENVAETTFLAMVCNLLEQHPVQIEHVSVSGKTGPDYAAVHAAAAHAVAVNSPEQLSSFYPSRRALDDATREALAQDFLRIRNETGLLRRWEKGKVVGVPLDFYDGQLLEACTAQWTLAARVIGTAMAQCDAANAMSDLFFSTRLQTLIAAGKVQANGPRYASYRHYSVRRANSQ